MLNYFSSKFFFKKPFYSNRTRPCTHKSLSIEQIKLDTDDSHYVTQRQLQGAVKIAGTSNSPLTQFRGSSTAWRHAPLPSHVTRGGVFPSCLFEVTCHSRAAPDGRLALIEFLIASVFCDLILWSICDDDYRWDFIYNFLVTY